MFTVFAGCCPSWLTTDRKLCLLCQTVAMAKGILVFNPRNDSYQHLSDSVQERSTLHNGDYVRIHQGLKTCTPATLPSWFEEQSCSEAACCHGCFESNRWLYGELWNWWRLDNYGPATTRNPEVQPLQTCTSCSHLFIHIDVWIGPRWVLQGITSTKGCLPGGSRRIRWRLWSSG